MQYSLYKLSKRTCAPYHSLFSTLPVSKVKPQESAERHGPVQNVFLMASILELGLKLFSHRLLGRARVDYTIYPGLQ